MVASGKAPLGYQWRFEGLDVAKATNTSLSLTNVQLTDAGRYAVVVSDSSRSVTSSVAVLNVDPTFTKITKREIVSIPGAYFNASWVDFNNDGYLDLFAGIPGGTNNFLFQNNKDGTFTRASLAALPPSGNQQHSGVWADFNNDGFIDLLVTGGQHETGAPGSFRNVLYQNNGDGTFRKITNGIFATEIGQFHGAAWVDYDRDGFLDLFITHHAASPPAKNRLYHGNGDGTFTKITTGVVVNNPEGDYLGWAWADYDNDGWPDLFLPVSDGQSNYLYHNGGNGQFSAVTNSVVVLEGGLSEFAAWGDYDNDGYPDLFVANADFSQTRTMHNSLFHNEGNGTFIKVTQGSVVQDTSLGGFGGCAWADYDNDGFLDLITAPLDTIEMEGHSDLYHNNGDGTFTKVDHGNLTSDRIFRPMYAWGDYDRDGFLDLFVANGGGWETSHPAGTPFPVNHLYHNNGNSNAWIDIKLVGTVSNRSAIGAKVRLKAFYRGASRWQLREISAGDGNGAQQPLNAHFGLGDATNIDVVRIEWPSGIVQTMTNVPIRQFLSATEPSRLLASEQADGHHFVLKGGLGLQYQIQASHDLVVWAKIDSLTVTNGNGMVEIRDSGTFVSDRRYYRAVSQE